MNLSDSERVISVLDKAGRFSDIIEGEESLHLLASDYKKYI